MRGGLLLTILLGLIGLTFVALLLLPENSRIAGLDDDEFAYLAYLSIIALAIAAGFNLRSIKFSKVARDIGIWGLFGLLLVVGYTLKDDLRPVWQRVTASLVPGQPINITDDRVHIIRNSTGEFVVKASVNSAPVDFIFDTGASAVVLTYDDAVRAGFSPDRLSFYISVNTANGRTTAAPIVIGNITVGNITRKKVRGLIAHKDDLKTSLLGMTFMNELQGFSVEGERLELRN